MPGSSPASNAAGRRASILVLLVCAGWLAVASGPTQPAWNDENYSRENFVAGGPLVILTDYHQPNNHILFNLARWSWMRLAGNHTATERLLPLGFALLALAAVWSGGRSLGGNTGAACAAIAFATSLSVAAFAAQLRGYSLSLALISGATVCALHWSRRRYASPYTALGYAASGAAAIAVIPTNALFLALLAPWAVLTGGTPPPRRRLAFAITLAAPVVGFLAYHAVWDELMHHLRTVSAPPARGLGRALLGELMGADLWMTYPALAAGAYLAWRQRTATPALWLLVLALIGACLPLIGMRAHPRSFLALTVLASIGAGGVLGTLAGRHGRAVAAALVLALAAGSVARGVWLDAGAPERFRAAGGRPGGLVDQYYRAPGYRPDEVIEALRTVPEQTLLLTDDDLAWDLASYFHGERTPVATCILVEDEFRCAFPGDAAPQGEAAFERIWAVHWDSAAADRMARRVGRALGLSPAPGVTLEEARLPRVNQYLIRTYELSRERPSTGG